MSQFEFENLKDFFGPYKVTLVASQKRVCFWTEIDDPILHGIHLNDELKGFQSNLTNHILQERTT